MRIALTAPCAAICAVLSGPSWATPPDVVTDIPAVHSLTQQVMGDLGQPLLLLESGANAHDYQLRPSQAGALADADLVVWIGPDMTPWLGRALDGMAKSADRLTLLSAEGTVRIAYGEADTEEHGVVEHEEEDEHEDDHAHDGIDPHAWLDPANARHWLGLIAGELAALDPENAATYRGNADRATTAISALEAEIAETLAPAQGAPIMMFHDAYGYFAGHFGLTIVGSIAKGDAAAPGAARIAELRDDLAEKGVVCIFPEAQHDPKYIATVTEGTDIAIGQPLDPEGSSLEPGPGLYTDLLHRLASGIASCVTAARG